MSQATDMLAQYLAAEAAILKGQAHTWGDKSLTRADLATIRKGRQEWQAIVAAEQAAAAGQGGYSSVVSFEDY